MNTVRTRRRFDIINYMPLIIGVVAVALIVALISVIFSSGEKEIKREWLKELPVKSTQNYKVFADGVVYIDNDLNEIYYIDDRCEKMWGFSGTTAEMVIYTSDEYVGVAVGKKLQVISKDGNLVFSKEFEKNILSVSMGKKLIAVGLSHSDDTIILNSNGEEIDRITSSVNCTNIRFGIYGESSVWVITVENAGYSPQYMLSTYKYDTEKTQTVTFEEDSQMIYNTVFDDKVCYIFGTEKIMVRDCDYTGSVNLDYTVNGFDVASYGKVNKNVHLLLINNGTLKAIGKDGIKTLSCPEKLGFGVVARNGYYGFSNYFMYTFDTNSGQSTRYRFPVRVDGLVQGNGFAIIKSGEKLFRYDYGV